MLISAIRLMDQKAIPVDGLHHATVVLTSDTGQLSVQARARAPDGATPADVTRALIDDALRQITRLPEYRGGARTVQIAKDAMPGQSRGA